MSAIIVLSLLGVLLIGLNEYAREKQYMEQMKKIELDKQEEVKLKRKDRCCECSYYRELTYSNEEKLWLCRNCE